VVVNGKRNTNSYFLSLPSPILKETGLVFTGINSCASTIVFLNLNWRLNNQINRHRVVELGRVIWRVMSDCSINRPGKPNFWIQIPVIVRQGSELLRKHPLSIAFTHSEFGIAVVVFKLSLPHPQSIRRILTHTPQIRESL
jgi:hypothetical protein